MEDVLLAVPQPFDPGQENLLLQPLFPYPFPSSDQQFFEVVFTYFFNDVPNKALISVVATRQFRNLIKKASAKWKHGVIHICIPSASCLSSVSYVGCLPQGASQAQGSSFEEQRRGTSGANRLQGFHVVDRLSSQAVCLRGK